MKYIFTIFIFLFNLIKIAAQNDQETASNNQSVAPIFQTTKSAMGQKSQTQSAAPSIFSKSTSSTESDKKFPSAAPSIFSKSSDKAASGQKTQSAAPSIFTKAPEPPKELIAAEKSKDKRFSQPAILHLIIFCETQDTRIDKASLTSYKYFSSEFKDLMVQYSGMSVKTHLYYNNFFTLENLQKMIANLRVDTEDAILFWFDGHGYNAKNGDFPTLTLPNIQNSKGLQDIYDQLKAKNARLTLVFANACNRENSARAQTLGTLVTTNGSSNYSSDKIYRLFRTARGSLMVASSKRGQASHGTPSGAWYFLGLRDAFDKVLNTNEKEPVTWQQCLEIAKLRTEAIASSNSYDQNPISTIFIEN